jgi:hypothetical protein
MTWVDIDANNLAADVICSMGLFIVVETYLKKKKKKF